MKVYVFKDGDKKEITGEVKEFALGLMKIPEDLGVNLMMNFEWLEDVLMYHARMNVVLTPDASEAEIYLWGQIYTRSLI